MWISYVYGKNNMKYLRKKTDFFTMYFGELLTTFTYIGRTAGLSKNEK